MVVKFHITRNNTHILASVLFPLETTSAARINPSVAWRHLFKLQPHHISCFSPGLSCLYSGTLPETLPSPPYPRRSHHLRKGVRKRNSCNQTKLTNPELNPEDVSPVKCTDNQPGESQHNIHPTHGLKRRVSNETEVP